MKGKVKYRVEYRPTFMDIDVLIDWDYELHNKSAYKDVEDMVKQMVEFWAGWREKLKENKGNYTENFLKNFCEQCLLYSAYDNYNVVGIIDEFNDKEGWCPMDGSWGITLLDISPPDFGSQDDYTVEEIKL